MFTSSCRSPKYARRQRLARTPRKSMPALFFQWLLNTFDAESYRSHILDDFRVFTISNLGPCDFKSCVLFDVIYSVLQLLYGTHVSFLLFSHFVATSTISKTSPVGQILSLYAVLEGSIPQRNPLSPVPLSPKIHLRVILDSPESISGSPNHLKS